MRLMYFYILLVIAAIGCTRPSPPPAASPEERRSNYEVQFLFDIDGCKIYNFYDPHNNPRAFATCPGIVSGSHKELHGKIVVEKRDDTATAVRPR